MHWNSLTDFLAMGGYGVYVLGAFGVVALVLALEPFLALRRHRQTLARLKRQLRTETHAPVNHAE